jgi:putative ABC transport system permease protein
VTRWSYAFNIAVAELRSGIKGFRLFLVCLAIGVAAIAAAGSMAQAFRSGLDAEQRRILGGDFVLNLRQRTPCPKLAASHAKPRTTHLLQPARHHVVGH